MKKRIVPGDGDPRHGTLNGYSNLACRCTECRQANVDRVAQNKANRPAWLPHGTPHSYSNYSCRCDECRAAHTDYVWANAKERRLNSSAGGLAKR